MLLSNHLSMLYYYMSLSCRNFLFFNHIHLHETLYERRWGKQYVFAAVNCDTASSSFHFTSSKCCDSVQVKQSASFLLPNLSDYMVSWPEDLYHIFHAVIYFCFICILLTKLLPITYIQPQKAIQYLSVLINNIIFCFCSYPLGTCSAFLTNIIYQ